MLKKFIIAPDGLYFFLITLVPTALFLYVFWPIGVALALLAAFVLAFFRNPRRVAPKEGKAFVSPADGKVMGVETVDGEDFVGDGATRVSIFLSVFNVHVNRVPVAGVVRHVGYRKGRFLPAYRKDASNFNERGTIHVEGDDGFRVVVHQVTGLIARRVVRWVKEGDRLERGERFGLIRFGSCTEVIVPAGASVCVKPGDKVKGAKTVLGRY
ncbi:MAG: phosphatidylserine decarboxylase family protein [Oscillospiraceae bacterium]|nr:phosphatidylserine decarboxylase family protein [Oscillospiraceae bacterium]